MIIIVIIIAIVIPAAVHLHGGEHECKCTTAFRQIAKDLHPHRQVGGVVPRVSLLSGAG